MDTDVETSNPEILDKACAVIYRDIKKALPDALRSNSLIKKNGDKLGGKIKDGIQPFTQEEIKCALEIYDHLLSENPAKNLHDIVREIAQDPEKYYEHKSFLTHTASAKKVT